MVWHLISMYINHEKHFNIWNYFEKLSILLLVTWTTTTSNTPMPLLIECTLQLVIEYYALFMGFVIYLQTGITLCCHFCAIRRSELPLLQDKPLQNFIHSEQANCSAMPMDSFLHTSTFIVVDDWHGHSSIPAEVGTNDSEKNIN